jgi:hypothetical protein
MAWTVDYCMQQFHWRAYTTTTDSWSPITTWQAIKWCQANLDHLDAEARQIEQQHRDQQLLEFVGLILTIVVVVGLIFKSRSRIGAGLRKALVMFLTLVIASHRLVRDFTVSVKSEASERLADRARR